MLPLFRYSLLALFLPPFQTTFVHVRLSLDNNLGRETRVAEKSGRQSRFSISVFPRATVKQNNFIDSRSFRQIVALDHRLRPKSF